MSREPAAYVQQAHASMPHAAAQVEQRARELDRLRVHGEVSSSGAHVEGYSYYLWKGGKGVRI